MSEEAMSTNSTNHVSNSDNPAPDDTLSGDEKPKFDWDTINDRSLVVGRGGERHEDIAYGPVTRGALLDLHERVKVLEGPREDKVRQDATKTEEAKA